MICAQCSRSLISPTLRQNTDYLVIRNLNDDYVKSLFESVYWQGNVKSFIDFTKASLRNTTYEFLCYNNAIDKEEEQWSLLLAEESDFSKNVEKM